MNGKQLKGVRIKNGGCGVRAYFILSRNSCDGRKSMKNSVKTADNSAHIQTGYLRTTNVIATLA
jgi:hypothetical protein